MKFTEMPYERVDVEKLKSDIRKVTGDFKAADSLDGVISAMTDMDALMKSYCTMRNIAYIRYTINTADPFYVEENRYFSATAPYIEEALQDYYKALVKTPFRAQLEEKYGTLIFMRQACAIKGFAPEITELMQQEADLEMAYQQIMGKAVIHFEGQELSLAEMGKYVSNADAAVRKKAYSAMGAFYDAKREALDDIYDKLVKNRTAQAQALGYDSYVDLAYIRRERSYTVEDVRNYRQQVVEDLVPLTVKLKKEQAKRIGVEKISLSDNGTLFKDGNAVPKGTPEDLLNAAKDMYSEMHPETKAFIEFMFENALFDVLPKPGKTTGAYEESLPDYKCPFIFSSFSGTEGDVETLTHEAGHAFADYVASRTLPLLDMQLPTMEAAETHSMSMEFLSAPWHHMFFGEETDKYAYSHLAGALFFIPYGCMVDHMQEICYLHPELTPEERNAKWLELEQIYRPYLDLAGFPAYERGAGWQRQLHLYTVPYYYIDYCLAETVALQFFMASLKDWKAAFEKYLSFVHMGGRKTFVELTKDAGLKTPFEDGALKDIMDGASKWLDENPVK